MEGFHRGGGGEEESPLVLRTPSSNGGGTYSMYGQGGVVGLEAEIRQETGGHGGVI